MNCRKWNQLIGSIVILARVISNFITHLLMHQFVDALGVARCYVITVMLHGKVCVSNVTLDTMIGRRCTTKKNIVVTSCSLKVKGKSLRNFV